MHVLNKHAIMCIVNVISCVTSYGGEHIVSNSRISSRFLKHTVDDRALALALPQMAIVGRGSTCHKTCDQHPSS